MSKQILWYPDSLLSENDTIAPVSAATLLTVAVPVITVAIAFGAVGFYVLLFWLIHKGAEFLYKQFPILKTDPFHEISKRLHSR